MDNISLRPGGRSFLRTLAPHLNRGAQQQRSIFAASSAGGNANEKCNGVAEKVEVEPVQAPAEAGPEDNIKNVKAVGVGDIEVEKDKKNESISSGNGDVVDNVGGDSAKPDVNVVDCSTKVSSTTTVTSAQIQMQLQNSLMINLKQLGIREEDVSGGSGCGCV